QVRGFDEVVVAAHGQRLRVGDGLLEARGEFVHAHGGFPANRGALAPNVLQMRFPRRDSSQVAPAVAAGLWSRQPPTGSRRCPDSPPSPAPCCWPCPSPPPRRRWTPRNSGSTPRSTPARPIPSPCSAGWS